MIREAAPGVQLNYTVSLRGQTLTQDTTSVDLTGATAEELAAAAQVLPLLPALMACPPNLLATPVSSRVSPIPF